MKRLVVVLLIVATCLVGTVLPAVAGPYPPIITPNSR